MKDEGPPLDTFSASVADISVLAAGDEEWMNGDSGRWEATSLRAAWSRVHDRTLCHVTLVPGISQRENAIGGSVDGPCVLPLD